MAVVRLELLHALVGSNLSVERGLDINSAQNLALVSRPGHAWGTRAAIVLRRLLSIAQQFHVTQCFGGMSHCILFCNLTLYLMLSHVLAFLVEPFWG